MIELIEEIDSEIKKIKNKIISVYGQYYGDELSTLIGNLRDMHSVVYQLVGKLAELECKNNKLEEELNQLKSELIDLRYRKNGS